jgi:polysaccharide deacetylase family protein (PEP-CTERM system associated)
MPLRLPDRRRDIDRAARGGSGELCGRPPLKNALSIDVEDYFQVTGFEHAVDRADWDKYPSRFRIGMRTILDTLARHETKATFFFLGWIADRAPDVVAEVAERGHEIGIHSYEHRLVYQQVPTSFEDDLMRAIAAVRKTYDGPLLGYRAPTFSIRHDSLWALKILRQVGFHYDSSIFPIRRERYGMPEAPAAPYEIIEGLIEFPMSVVDWLGRRLPVCGGGYFRLYPFAVTCRAIRYLNEKQGRPAIVYLHPWEFDPEQPVIAGSWGNTFRHRVNLARTAARFDELCQRFVFTTMREVLTL